MDEWPLSSARTDVYCTVESGLRTVRLNVSGDRHWTMIVALLDSGEEASNWKLIDLS